MEYAVLVSCFQITQTEKACANKIDPDLSASFYLYHNLLPFKDLLPEPNNSDRKSMWRQNSPRLTVLFTFLCKLFIDNQGGLVQIIIWNSPFKASTQSVWTHKSPPDWWPSKWVFKKYIRTVTVYKWSFQVQLWRTWLLPCQINAKLYRPKCFDIQMKNWLYWKSTEIMTSAIKGCIDIPPTWWSFFFRSTVLQQLPYLYHQSDAVPFKPRISKIFLSE